jgi:hypothetical protein
VTPAEELRHLAGQGADDPVPEGFELDTQTYPGGEPVLERAGEVMRAVLGGETLPAWFVDQCVDDSTVQTCTLDRWSLRAWRFWLAPENRRWWWWSAEPGAEGIRLRALVRTRPYLRGSLDWLFKAAGNVPFPRGNTRGEG